MVVRMLLRSCIWWLLGVALAAPGHAADALAHGHMVPGATSSPGQQKLATLLPAVHLPDDAETVLDEACILPGSEALPDLDAAWLHLSLPHRWSQTHPGFEGTMWYRFRVRLDHMPTSHWAVYLPRAVMNAQVWINDVPLAYTGSMTEPVTRNWYVPLLVQVPSGVWREGENLIMVKVVSGYASRDGLAPIHVGPLSRLERPYKLRTLLQVDALNFANIALFALGMFMVIVWVRDRDQGAIGFQGVAAALWSIANMMLTAPNPFFKPVLWEHVSFTALVWSELLMSLFFWRFVGRRSWWVDGLVFLLMALVPVWSYVRPSVWVTAITFCMIYLIVLLSITRAIGAVIRYKRRDGGWLLAGCALLLPSAAHDLAYQLNLLPFDTIYLLPYVGPFMMGCVFYMLAGDYARSRQALNNLNGNLAETLAQRERALRESFARLSELERAQAVSAERSRILRDMHDGVGAHLTSALRQLQSPRDSGVDLGLVTQTLRDSLDQLKLSIDALSLPPGDVVGLLASLRFRITPRLKAAGLEMVWDVADLPPWPDGQAPALRQLQYILFEGLSNVLQHSDATRLTLSARAFDDHLQVSLIDNGHGWRNAGEGQGLQTMRARASVIGAAIAFLSVPDGGVELRVSLPLQHTALTDLSSAA